MAIMISTQNDKGVALDLLYAFLIDAGFDGFRFDTAFTLYFSREKAVRYDGNELPRILELHLLGDWWIGGLNEWRNKVTEMGSGIEPDEPVKAYELAKLRWTEGSNIEDISFSENIFSIIFRNKNEISISLQTDDEYAFMLKEFMVNEDDNLGWSVTCENENYYSRVK